MRILIVDQNVTRASILEEGLREAGYRDVTVQRDMQYLMRRILEVDPDVATATDAVSGRALQRAAQHVAVQAVRRFLLEQPLEPVIRLEQLGGPVTRDGPDDRREPVVPVDQGAKAIKGHPSIGGSRSSSAT